MSIRVTPAVAPARPDELGRIVLMLAACIWAGHFVLLSAANHFIPGRASDPSTLLARAAVSAVGIGLCLGIYALLWRRAGPRPWPLFLQAGALGVVSAAILVLVGKLAFLKIAPYYSRYPEEFLDPYLTGLVFVGYLWMQLAWSALFAGAVAIGEMRRRDAQLAAMHEAGRQARLLALRLQINPHFLFNTLNTLAGFIVLGRKEESERIVLNLSQFFRHTLTHTSSQFVALGDEVGMLRLYLEIETTRFRDRLRVRYDVPAECEVALVPGLILAPLAENSIRHALAGSEEGIEISVGARREDEALLLWLQDDGPVAEDGGTQGAGLANTRQQLTALYGDAAALDAGPHAHGWRNLIRIPWREAGP